MHNAQPLLAGASIQKLLSTISQVVEGAIYGEDPITSDSWEKIEIESDDEVTYDYDDEDWEESSGGNNLAPAKAEAEIRPMLRRDLRAVKNAGFKVGCLGTLTGAVIIALSCRIGRLGISEDAMQAWDVKPSEYLMLLIRYPSAYRDLADLLRNPGNAANPLIQMYVGLCHSYKPSHDDAVRVFQGKAADQQQGDDSAAEPGVAGHSIRRLFIDKAINSLLNERFMTIVNYRLKLGLSWTGAELYAHHFQGKPSSCQDELPDEYFEPDSWSSSTPQFLTADHIAQSNHDQSQILLPLLAIQFTLRHFVKCTEFCLICHCRIRANFEALKPYVCSNSLCLYQYMALGMGPSLEYEIISQPYIVDMLVSLTYTRALSGQLADFPTGLGLKVPEGVRYAGQSTYDNVYYQLQSYTDQGQPAPQPVQKSYTAALDPVSMDLFVEEMPPLRVGDWIVITECEGDKSTKGKGKETNGEAANDQNQWHCRVQDIDSRHGIQLSFPMNYGELPILAKPGSGQNPRAAIKFVIYNKNFDDLPDYSKREVILLLLSTLPSIDAMTQFLDDNQNGESLSSWRDMISPAALDVLRWIVASNRSCIMFDDDDNSQHRVTGMEGYVQFRLVQGAPDKEQKFTNAVKKHTANKKHPTIFAWHGSPLHNWHSILREGLHYNQILHGRACGHGVYMAQHFTTSAGYSNRWGNPNSNSCWPQSKLKITMAISLNEVVNAPKEFVCAGQVHVVNKLDWIQPRYLFVQCKDSLSKAKKDTLPSAIYEQDPQHLVHGPNGTVITLPASRLGGRGQQVLKKPKEEKKPANKPPAKRPSPKAPAKRNTKRRRTSRKTKAPEPEPEPEEPDDSVFEIEPPAAKAEAAVGTNDDDSASVATLFEDLQVLLSDVEDMEDDIEVVPKGPPTDFEPGTLKKETLPLLIHPKYATTSATKALQQHLQATLRIQEKEPPGALGWYVDPNLISTVYQWIVELHSFDPELPLAKDLKRAGLKSIVLELRFPPKFPMAPPFVRVIRPRLLEFNHGGGGHVTAGGAMCMELLTNSGWLPTSTIESILLQVRLALMSTDPRPARLATDRIGDYTAGGAFEAYRRACLTHGWEVPADIQEVSWT